ncbi:MULTISPECIES: ABC transporter permease [unclassified Lysinibacillus]|uniref:ABC transporter permease n=1 Tax=unclassified Lysinibacillus TaxID=2636778 RepID=UPI00201158D9|nr:MULTISPECIES: ABC transporter permease [unclassified Lysinibacillus]MCL1696902.1 ABC transporter permease [Lysinibacillus sp. BPa_S21]MCL1701561.1 ABC transporter permease [Lysinibacillus sp. Bpr_S20]
MLHLLKLEMKKFNLGWYVKGAIIANIVLTTIMCLVIYIAQSEGDLLISTYEDVNILIGASVRATFIVFASVLIAKLVIEEYKNRTILIMFTYPVSRKKLIASKLVLIAVLTLIAMMLTNIVVVGLFSIINSYFPIVPFTITTNQFIGEVINIVPFAIASTGISLIPLYFGMRNHSVPATIGSSLLVVAIACSYNPEISLVSFIPLQLGLAVVGVIIAYLGIRNIENEDAV